MKDMTTGKEWKVVLSFATPMLLGSILQQAYSLVDSIVVGKHIGKEALAATGASWPLLYILIALVIGIGSGNTVVIAQYFGAKKIPEVRKAVSTQIIFLVFIAIFISLIGYFFHRPLLVLVNVPDTVLNLASEYFAIMMFGLPLLFGYNAIASILRGLGDSKTPLLFMLLSTIINISLSILFVLYFQWGVASVAWATVIAQGTAFISACIYLNKTHPILSFSWKELKFSKALFAQSIQLGLPTGIQQSTVALGIVAIWSIVNTFGEDTMAAYTAAGRIDAIAIIPAMLIGSALSSFVGQNTGAGKHERVKRAFKATLLMGIGMSLLISAIIHLVDKQLISLFLEKGAASEPVLATAQTYLHIVTPFYFLFAAMFAYHGLFRGSGDSLVPMYISIISLWGFRIPLAFYFSKGDMQELGIWWSIPIAWTISLIVSATYYTTGRWKHKTVVKNK